MRFLRLLPLALALLVTTGCFGRSNKTAAATPGPSGPVAAAVTGGGRVLLDPRATTAVLGTILLVNTLAAGTANGDILFRMGGGPGATPAQSEVTLAPGESRSVPITTLTPLIALVTLVVTGEYIVGGLLRTFNLQWVNEAAANNAYLVLSQFGNPQLVTLWFAATVLAPIGVLTRHSSNLVPQRMPLARTEVRLIGAVLLLFTLIQLQATFAGTQDTEAFPVGQGPHGFTVQASPSVPLTAGEYCTFWLSTSATIPLNDPQQHYQYAFVMDSDANVANNYVPGPNYPDDFFGGTDRWYELAHAPGTGWQLQCKAIGPGNSITTVASAAHAILRQDSIVLFVPRSEFVLAHPPFRATSFCHDGGYGLNPPHEWSGDPTPTVAEPLHAWN